MKNDNVAFVITGANGFSAYYLCKYVKEIHHNSQCLGIDIDQNSSNPYIDNYYSLRDFKVFREDLIRLDYPVKLFHLAGLLGHRGLTELIEANVLWTSRYIEVFDELNNPDCFINIGSSAEYGKQATQLLTEDMTPNPVNNYGLSKHLQSKLVESIRKTDSKYYAINTRTFNLIGPGLTGNLVAGKLIKEFLDVYYGKKNEIEIGRLDSIRDFIDVRDAVKYYFSLSVLKPDYNYVNVASGTVHSIKNVMDIISEELRITPEINQYHNIELRGDVDASMADISILKSCFPEITCRKISESISDMIEYERRK